VTSDGVRIALGSVFQPPEEPYARVLVMRRWPRGIAKGTVDQWEPDLGPSVGLLSAYEAGEVAWDAFAERYREEVLGRPHLLDWVARMASGTGVTLLCGSHPDEECHRTVLASILRERLGQS